MDEKMNLASLKPRANKEVLRIFAKVFSLNVDTNLTIYPEIANTNQRDFIPRQTQLAITPRGHVEIPTFIKQLKSAAAMPLPHRLFQIELRWDSNMYRRGAAGKSNHILRLGIKNSKIPRSSASPRF